MSEAAIIGVLKDQLNLANQRCAQLEILLVREREDRNAVIAEATTELNVQIGFLEEKVKELEHTILDHDNCANDRLAEQLDAQETALTSDINEKLDSLTEERNKASALYASAMKKIVELEDEHSGLCGTLASRDTEIADLRQRLDGAIFTTNHNFMSAEKWKEQAIRIQETNVTMAAGLYEILTMGTCGNCLSPEARLAKEVLEETEWKSGKELFPDVGSNTPVEVVKDEE